MTLPSAEPLSSVLLIGPGNVTNAVRSIANSVAICCKFTLIFIRIKNCCI